MLTALELTLILLIAAIAMVAVLRMVKMPALVAYLAVGIVLGPHAINLASDQHAVHSLGEIGVVFLMFSLGLEFNLAKLTSMRRLVFGLGGAQVIATIVATMLLFALIPGGLALSLFGGEMDWRAALALGGAAAMSSTALVSKLLAERRELESDHGQRALTNALKKNEAYILSIKKVLTGDLEYAKFNKDSILATVSEPISEEELKPSKADLKFREKIAEEEKKSKTQKKKK